MLRLALILPLAFLVSSPIMASQAKQPLIGGDADKHGCRASAGYLWCAATKRCERPWELAKAKGFKNTPKAFKRFCGRK